MKSVVGLGLLWALSWSDARAADGFELPTGRLMLVAGGAKNAAFLQIDRVSKVGQTAELWGYQVYDPGILLGPDKIIVQGVLHETLDCATHTRHELGVAGYDEAGGRQVSTPAAPEQPIEPRSSHDFYFKVLCEGAMPPTPQPIQGYQQALAIARAALRTKP